MQSQRHCTTRRPCVCPFPVRGRMPIAPRVGAASDGDTIAATAIGQDFAVRDISCALRSTNEGKNCTTVIIVAAPRRIPIAGFRDKLPMTSSDDREPLSATSGRTPAVNGQPSISITVARGARAQDERMKVQFGWSNFDCPLGPSMGQVISLAHSALQDTTPTFCTSASGSITPSTSIASTSPLCWAASTRRSMRARS